MAPGESSRSSSSKSKKPSTHSNDENDHPSVHRGSSSNSSTSSKKPDRDKAPQTSLLGSIFMKDAPSSKRLESAIFQDDEKTSSSKARPKSSSGPKSSKLKPKTEKEKAKKEKVVEDDETYEDEPDFSQFQSTYSEPVKEREEKREEKTKEKRKEEKKQESPRREESSRREKSSVRKESSIPTKSIAASKFKTTFQSTYDISMAEKQITITELKGQELVKQEKWAHEKLKTHAGTCPKGYNWHRFKQKAIPYQVEMEGYLCLGGGHFVTHELLAKGTGEIYVYTDLYSDFVNRIMLGMLPIQMPYLGQRWQGPISNAAMSESNMSVEEQAQQIIVGMYGYRLHSTSPALISIMIQQKVQEIILGEEEARRVYAMKNAFAERPSSTGGPWWEDLA